MSNRNATVPRWIRAPERGPSDNNVEQNCWGATKRSRAWDRLGLRAPETFRRLALNFDRQRATDGVAQPLGRPGQRQGETERFGPLPVTIRVGPLTGHRTVL